MTDWSEGYVTEIDYTYGYYKEMAPVAIRFALHAAGYEAPPLEKFTYCELGFGQGAGLNLLAAAYPHGDFWGTDFNPAHAAGAENIARACGLANLHAFDDNFEQFTQRDLPKFDYITLHGIWSWVSAQNRQQIVEFISRHLKVGGAVYISYNTLPGWTHALPMRGLLSQFVEHQAAPADPFAARFENAMKLLTELNDIPGSYFKQTPQLAERIKHLQTQNKNYLVHEYLNQHWTPMFFSQAVDELQSAKVTFAAHANPLNCVDALNHSKELQAALDRIANPIFKELVRDYGINQTFRRDIYVRGPRKLGREEHGATLLDTQFALTTARANCSMTLKTQVGEAQLQPAIYQPLLDAFATGPRSGRSLLDHPALSEAGGTNRLVQALVVMVGAGYLHPCVPQAISQPAQASVARFNSYIMTRSARTPEGELMFLASPLLGSGLAQSRVTQLILRAMQQQPKADTSALARTVWSVLRIYGQSLRKDGVTLEGEEANLAELSERITEWQASEWPMLKHLKMI